MFSGFFGQEAKLRAIISATCNIALRQDFDVAKDGGQIRARMVGGFASSGQ